MGSQGGNRRRSLSESEADELTTNPIDPLLSNEGLNLIPLPRLSQGGSHPNLSCSGQGFISTPINEGANTRLGSRRINDNLHIRVVEEYQNLQNQIHQWMILISSDRQTDKDDIERVAETFIKRINELDQGCLIKKIDFKVHANILQLLPVVKKARRTHLRISGIPDEIEYENSQDEEDDQIFLNQSQATKMKETIFNSEKVAQVECEKEKENQSNLSDIDAKLIKAKSDEIETIERTKALRQQQALATVRSTTEVNDDSMFNGFNTLIDEIEELKLLIEKNKKISETKNWNNEKKIVSVNTELKKLERAVLVVSANLQDVENTASSNSVRIGILEEKHYNLVLSVKGVEKKILKRINE